MMSKVFVQSTIFALSSAPGRSGVAVIRVSGSRAETILNLMAPPRAQPKVFSLRKIIHPHKGTVLDKGMTLWLPQPKSFTGEDCAEFHIHGGRAVVSAVLEALSAIPDCRLAEPGEFVRRAFENGKLDLAEAEGLADLLQAETEAQRVQALRQASGELSIIVESWRSRIVEALALVEAALDFSDEADVVKNTFDQARDSIRALEASLSHFLKDANRGEILREGFRVVLVGPPNVGKSSLLNTLARRDAALVSEEAGTTRDVVEVHLDINGFPIIVSDTAGLRPTEHHLERAGISKTLDTARVANLILCLIDLSSPQSQIPEDLKPFADRILHVYNKRDVLKTLSGKQLPEDGILVSAKTGEGIDELTKRIGLIAKECLQSKIQAPSLTNIRQRSLVEDAYRNLIVFLESNPHQIELRAEDLRRAALSLGRLTGRIEVEEILGRIFSRFCIGK